MAFCMHHVENDDRVVTQLNEHHVRELVHNQFTCARNPVAFPDPLGIEGKGLDLADYPLFHRFCHSQAGLQVNRSDFFPTGVCLAVDVPTELIERVPAVESTSFSRKR